MRVFIDTNILVSAALFPGSTPARAYDLAVSSPNEAVICDQVVDEMRRVFARKFPDKLASLDSFLSAMASAVRIAETPVEALPPEDGIRDPMDRPILRAALACRADVLITGDKDFLESGLAHAAIMTAAEFCETQAARP